MAFSPPLLAGQSVLAFERFVLRLSTVCCFRVIFELGLFCVNLVFFGVCVQQITVYSRNNNVVMSNSLDRKVKKLYAARSMREVEMNSIHENLLHCINSQIIGVKIERLVTKRKEAFMGVVDKNEDLIMFAGKKCTCSLFRSVLGGNDI